MRYERGPRQALLLSASASATIAAGGEVAFGLGSGVAPAHVARDRVGLLGVAVVVGAVEREVAQGGELGFDPVEPGRIGR